MPETTHAELKAALKINKKYGKTPASITEFGHSLVSPTGKEGVSHTAVIRAAKGEYESNWIIDEINKLVRKARKLDPEYFKAETNFLVS